MWKRNSQVQKSRAFFFLLAEGCLLHAKKVADIIEVISLAILLPHLFLYKFVPVINGKGFRRYHHLVPVGFYVVFLWCFRDVKTVELNASSDLLFSFEDRQRHLREILLSREKLKLEEKKTVSFSSFFFLFFFPYLEVIVGDEHSE